MIGYDVGARFDPDGELSGLLEDADARRAEAAGGVDGEAESDGVSDHAEVLNAAAALAGKMLEAGDLHEGAGEEAMPHTGQFVRVAEGDQGDEDRHPGVNGHAAAGELYDDDAVTSDHGGLLDPLPRILSVQSVAPMISGAECEGVWPSYDLVAQADAVERAEAVAASGAILPDVPGLAGQEPRDDEVSAYQAKAAQGGQHLDFGLDLADGFAGPAREGDDRSDANWGEKDALTDRDADRPDGAAPVDDIGERFDDFSAGSRDFTTAEPVVALHDRDEAEGEASDFEPALDRLQTAPRPGRVARLADSKELDAAAADDAGGVRVPRAGGSSLSGVAAVEQPVDLSGLWGMLQNAERVLPKPGFSAVEGGGDAMEDGVEGEPDEPLGWLVKLLASGNADRRAGDGSRHAADKIAPENSRKGPTGQRHDPIYVMAVGGLSGTLMPVVPTPGTGTRSPPIPGQRNLA